FVRVVPGANESVQSSRVSITLELAAATVHGSLGGERQPAAKNRGRSRAQGGGPDAVDRSHARGGGQLQADRRRPPHAGRGRPPTARASASAWRLVTWVIAWPRIIASCASLSRLARSPV